MSAMQTSRTFPAPALLDHDAGPLALHAEERRRRPRMRNDALAMAVFSNGDDAGTLTPVRVTDTSLMGLGVLSPVAVAPGSAYSILHEAGCSPRQVGLVVRCEQDGEIFRLGLKGRCVAAGH